MKNKTDQISSKVMQNLARMPFKSVPPNSDRKSDVDDAPIPKKLKKFEVIELIGVGGMGRVYRGRHPDLDIPVAIKTVSRTHLRSDKGIERFKREARLATKLNHPNIVRVYDVDRDGNLYFIVSEFVNGSDLLQLLSVSPGSKIAVTDALNIVIQITKALVETAKHRIIHRDIKPANILVTTEGVPKLADLGIAKQDFADESPPTNSTLTQQGLAIGTLGYMAPEQILDSRNVDIRADLFSLGGTFFHILTGQPPFGGDNYCKMMANCLHGETPNARAVNPDLPIELSQLLLKMMHKDRRDRHQTPEELLEALEEIERMDFGVHPPSNGITSVNASLLGYKRRLKKRETTCPKCGAEIPIGFKFCGQCGYKTQSICPKCSSEIPVGFKYCGKCGFQIDDLDPSDHSPPVLRKTTLSSAMPISSSTVTKGRETKPPTTQRNERRQVAVLVAGVNGFTAMVDELDPEEVHDIMNQIFQGLSEAVHKEEGYVDRYGGTRIMALFGAPVAHEDDGNRACRSALAMQHYIDKFADECVSARDVRLRLQVAIHFGLVFVGGIGSEPHKDYAALGRTVELALNMESTASPGGILVSEAVVNMVKNDFEFGPVQEMEKANTSLKTRLLLYERSKRGPWPVDQYSTPFVGRADEVRHLVNLIQHSKTNRRWIEICGEQGVGKTRIVHEANQRTKPIKIVPILVTSTMHRDLYGLVKVLIHTILYEITSKGRLPENQDDFKTVLCKLGKDLEPYVDALWYLSAPPSLAVGAPDPDPQILRGIMEQGVLLLTRCFAKKNLNSVLFIDGYDRADDASIGLLERLGQHADGWPMSVITTVRTGRPMPLPDQVTLQLSPLSNKLAAKLFERLMHGAKVPEALRVDILERAIGIPFHIEEMVQTLVDNDILIPNLAGKRWSCKSGGSQVSLPPSLFSSMQSRIDCLSETERDLMRQISAQGVEFREDVAQAVRGDPKWQGPAVSPLLLDLKRRGLVEKNFTAGANAPSWRFRQPLMRDACYQTLPMRNRRELHACIAEAIRNLAGGAMAAVAESVAHHYEQAQTWRCAAEANLIVGQRASDMFLNDKALTVFRKTCEFMGKLNSSEESDIHTQVLASTGMIKIFLRVGSYQEAEDITETIQAIVVREIDKAQIHNLYGLLCHHRGFTDRAKARCRQAFDLIDNTPEAEGLKLDILYNLAKIYFREGDMDLAKATILDYRRIGTQDAGQSLIRADILEGNIAQIESRYAEAVELFSKARQTAERVGSMSDLATALNGLGNTMRDDGNYDGAKENFKQALSIWSKIGLTESVAGAHLNLGNLALSQGDFVDARKEHRLSLKAFQAIGHVRGIALVQINLAVAAIEEGRGRRAVKLAKAAVKSLEDAHYAVLRGQSLVILGEGYLTSNNMKKAKEIFCEILVTYEKDAHVAAIAGAWRGLGRVAIGNGNFQEAINNLENAIAQFKKLNREQETTRTQLYRAEALFRLGHGKEARSILERANERFEAMGAQRDSAHALRLLQKFST